MIPSHRVFPHREISRTCLKILTSYFSISHRTIRQNTKGKRRQPFIRSPPLCFESIQISKPPTVKTTSRPWSVPLKPNQWAPLLPLGNLSFPYNFKITLSSLHIFHPRPLPPKKNRISVGSSFFYSTTWCIPTNYPPPSGHTSAIYIFLHNASTTNCSAVKGHEE